MSGDGRAAEGKPFGYSAFLMGQLKKVNGQRCGYMPTFLSLLNFKKNGMLIEYDYLVRRVKSVMGDLPTLI
jgi:hypothetical protein